LIPDRPTNTARSESSDDPLFHPDFNTRYGIAGLTVEIMPNMFAYAEARLFNDRVGPQVRKLRGSTGSISGSKGVRRIL
jgi:hypothetical protein